MIVTQVKLSFALKEKLHHLHVSTGAGNVKRSPETGSHSYMCAFLFSFMDTLIYDDLYDLYLYLGVFAQTARFERVITEFKHSQMSYIYRQTALCCLRSESSQHNKTFHWLESRGRKSNDVGINKRNVKLCCAHTKRKGELLNIAGFACHECVTLATRWLQGAYSKWKLDPWNISRKKKKTAAGCQNTSCTDQAALLHTAKFIGVFMHFVKDYKCWKWYQTVT